MTTSDGLRRRTTARHRLPGDGTVDETGVVTSRDGEDLESFADACADAIAAHRH